VTGGKRISEKTLYVKKYEMIATIVMTGEWQELPIDIGIERAKLEDRITAGDKLVDGF
jgi:hypothetical protein